MNKMADRDTFLFLLEENKGIIYKVCNSYCKNLEDRRDLVQETIIQLWRSFEKYDDQYKFSTWMYRIVLNTAISFYRSESKRKKTTTSLHDSFFEMIEENDHEEELESNLVILHQFIGQLDELNKALMILYLENHGYKEISEILGITETNVATKLSRIKQKLTQQFSNLKKME